jgi:hypothetical protein
MENVYNNILSSEDIEYLIQHEETIAAKSKLDSLRVDSLHVDSLDVVNFSLELTDSIKKVIHEQFGLIISSVPMRWIKGDTPEHTDTSSLDFEHTYLIYLTDSIGEFVLDNASYPIIKNTAFKFNEGISHKTINTGDIPRLLLGPMNEFGIKVGIVSGIAYFELLDSEEETLGYQIDGSSGTFTIGNIEIGDLKGYTQWKIIFTDNPGISNPDIVYSNGTTLVSGFIYGLLAYVPTPTPTPPPPPPPPIFSMTSLFTNNAQVYYKPHSLAPGGIGGVKNYRKKAKKT